MNRYYEEATTETFYLESASILFGNNRRSQFRVDVKAQPVSSEKKKRKRENIAVNTPLSDLQLHVRTTPWSTATEFTELLFSREQLCSGLVAVHSLPGEGEGEERFEKNDWDVIAFGNLFELVFALEIYGEETVMLLYIFFFLFLRIPRISIYGEIYGFRVVPTFCIFIRAKVIVE